MTKKSQIYKCLICGNIVEVLHAGEGTLVCCGKEMILQKENTTDAATEKHLPVIVGHLVKVSTVLHPMDDDHFIEWIEATSKEGVNAKVFLEPGMKPEATFPFDPVSAREFCNLHGVWKK